MMAFFQAMPVVIEAEQFTDENKNRVFHFITCTREASRDHQGNPVLLIQTLEGVMTCRIGDWVVKGLKGEFWPVKPDIFAVKYKAIDQDQEAA